MQLAEERKVTPAEIRHVTMPEEAFPSLAKGSCIAFLGKVGALRLARDGVTVRPLTEDSLSLKTFLASRADNSSRVLSALVRTFRSTKRHLIVSFDVANSESKPLLHNWWAAARRLATPRMNNLNSRELCANIQQPQPSHSIPAHPKLKLMTSFASNNFASFQTA